MNLFPAALLQGMGRSRKLKAYRRARAETEALSDAELADMGLKRYQLGHVARVRAFRT